MVFKKGKIFNFSKEELYDLYINKQLSTRKIAKLKGCSFSIIGNRLKEFNIPTRKIKHDCLKGKLDCIEDLYLNKKLSCPEIGKNLSVSGVAIRNFLKKNNIAIRPVGVDNLGKKKIFSEEHISHMNKDKIGIPRPIEVIEKIRKTIQKNGGRIGEKNSFYGKHHTEESKRAIKISKKGKKVKSKTSSLNNKQINQIIYLFTKEMWGAEKIGKLFNISSTPIIKILKENNINTSSKGKPKSKEQIKKSVQSRRINAEKIGYYFTKKTLDKMSISHSGEKSHLWKGGGISLGGYNWCEFNNKFRRAVRQRDNQICMNCGIHREKLRRALNVHHINYDKELNCLENCISLCDRCHSLTNINREYWKKIFQEKLSKIYGYQYSETRDIIIKLKNG